MHAVLYHAVARAPVERRHQPDGERFSLRGRKVGFGGRRQHADADRLGQKQHVARLCAAVCQHAAGVHKARHGQAVFGRRVVDAVPARNHRAGLVHFVVPAREDLVHRGLRHVLRNHQHVQRGLRFPAHGVDVGKRVRRGNLPERVRVVVDRRKKVDRLHDGDVVRHAVYARVVRRVEADEQVLVRAHADVLEQLAQHASANLCATARAFGQLGQLNILFHGYRLFPSASIASSTPPAMASALSETR